MNESNRAVVKIKNFSGIYIVASFDDVYPKIALETFLIAVTINLLKIKGLI